MRAGRLEYRALFSRPLDTSELPLGGVDKDGRLPEQPDSSHAALQNGPPYKALYGKDAYLGHIRVIGSRAFVHEEVHANKREHRRWKDRLVGFSEESKSYRIYNAETRRVGVSQNVIFIETPSVAPSFNARGFDDGEFTYYDHDDMLRDVRNYTSNHWADSLSHEHAVGDAVGNLSAIELLGQCVRQPIVILDLHLLDLLLPTMRLGLLVVHLRKTALPSGGESIPRWRSMMRLPLDRHLVRRRLLAHRPLVLLWYCAVGWFCAWTRFVSWWTRFRADACRHQVCFAWWICAGGITQRGGRGSGSAHGRGTRGGRGSTSTPATTGSASSVPTANTIRELCRLSHAFAVKGSFPTSPTETAHSASRNTRTL